MDRETDNADLSPLAAMQAELARANRKALLDEQLLDALRSFEKIMGYRNEMYLRLSQRVRTTVRGGMAVFAMIGLAMFVLLITLAMQVEHARESTSLLARHVASVASDMVRVESNVREMEVRMENFTTISGHMDTLTGYTTGIADGMQELDDSMQTIRSQMASINSRLVRMNRHMGMMGNAVNGMGYSTGQMSRPLSMFP